MSLVTLSFVFAVVIFIGLGAALWAVLTWPDEEQRRRDWR